MTRTYGMQTDKVLVRKYGSNWWKHLNRPGELARRVEQRIYQKRNDLANWLVPVTVALSVSIVIHGCFALWRMTQ